MKKRGEGDCGKAYKIEGISFFKQSILRELKNRGEGDRRIAYKIEAILFLKQSIVRKMKKEAREIAGERIKSREFVP